MYYHEFGTISQNSNDSIENRNDSFENYEIPNWPRSWLRGVHVLLKIRIQRSTCTTQDQNSVSTCTTQSKFRGVHVRWVQHHGKYTNMKIRHFNTTDIESALSKLMLTYLIELKRTAKNIKNQFTNKKNRSIQKKKNGDNPKCVTLSSDEIVEFITTFGPPVSLFVLLLSVVF